MSRCNGIPVVKRAHEGIRRHGLASRTQIAQVLPVYTVGYVSTLNLWMVIMTGP